VSLNLGKALGPRMTGVFTLWGGRRGVLKKKKDRRGEKIKILQPSFKREGKTIGKIKGKKRANFQLGKEEDWGRIREGGEKKMQK